MGKIITHTVQEILFSSSDQKETKRIARLLREGVIRKIAPKIYTYNLIDQPDAIIKRNWYHILAGLYPEAILSHRSALEFQPTATGDIYLTSTYNGKNKLPGLNVHLVKGPAKIEGDKPFFHDLHVSQEARAFLENLQPSRQRDNGKKTLTRKAVEEKLDQIIRVRGEGAVNNLRDVARRIYVSLNMRQEFDTLNQIISDLLATGDLSNLKSQTAIARAVGEPLDPNRIKLFEALYNELARATYPALKDINVSRTSYENFAFFEAYFSNFIEGTEFTLEEAKEIINNQKPLPTRNEDSHDILGTFRIVSDRSEMSIIPETPDALLNILRRRHHTLLHARLSKKPGEFKDRNNRAGNTEFVDWHLVNGTLKKGFELYSLLQDPFAKACFMMFLVSEVHPFLDGNGRIARVMMNAELSARGLSKIIIPTVFREDYIGALRKFSRQGDAATYIGMLARVYQFSSAIHADDLTAMESLLRRSDAFEDPQEGKLKLQV